MKGKKKYYCGPKYLPNIVLKILSVKFNLSCQLHDQHYHKNTRHSRKTADIMFLKNMKLQSNGSKLLILKAYFYYGMVRVLGKYYYKGKKK